MTTIREVLRDWPSLVVALAVIGGALILGFLVQYLLFKIARRLAKKNEKILENSLVKHGRGPAKVILPILAVYLFLPLVELAPKYMEILERGLDLFLILAVAWLIIKLTYVFEDIILGRFKIEPDPFKTRKINTQIQILRKVVAAIVVVAAVAIILMSFQKVRYLGTSILASAGIIGIIVGVAAQRSIGTLIAGLQIAITEPIHIDDAVVVEDEYGNIEEINLTYVVVRLWDLRRLILPINYFLEKPFQNWTRRSVNLLATVFIYVDYSVPASPVREELHRILTNSKLWDGQTWALHVTNATARSIEMRALMSARDAGNAWDLRCEVREKLIEFIRTNYPEGLPRIRADISDGRSQKKES